MKNKRKLFILFLVLFFVNCGYEKLSEPEGNGDQQKKYLNYLSVDGDGNLYVGTKYGEVFKSTDTGSNWKAFCSCSRDTNFKTIAVHSSGQIFMGGAGLYRSTDKGNSWEMIELETEMRMVHSLAFNSTGELALATGHGVFLSTDNGVSRVRNSTEGTTVYDCSDISFGPDNDIYYAVGIMEPDRVEMRLFKSINKFESWDEITYMIKRGPNPEKSYVKTGPLPSIVVNKSGWIFYYFGMGTLSFIDENGNKQDGYDNLSGFNYIIDIIIDRYKYLLALTCNNEFLRSPNNGENWSKSAFKMAGF